MSNQRSAKNYVGIKLIIVKAEDGSLLAIYLVTCLSFLSCLYSFLALDFIFYLRDMPWVHLDSLQYSEGIKLSSGVVTMRRNPDLYEDAD